LTDVKTATWRGRWEEIVMLWSTRRRAVETGVQFCDSCAEVTTTQQRAQRRYDRVRAEVQTLSWPR
jgi:hypothetical protein